MSTLYGREAGGGAPVWSGVGGGADGTGGAGAPAALATGACQRLKSQTQRFTKS